MPRKLTAKEAQFVKEYQVDLNGTQAAIRAGYRASSARTMSSDLLAKPYIKEALAKEVSVKIEKVDYSAERVLARLGEIAFDEHRDSVTTKALELLSKYHALTDGAGVKKKEADNKPEPKDLREVDTQDLLERINQAREA